MPVIASCFRSHEEDQSCASSSSSSSSSSLSSSSHRRGAQHGSLTYLYQTALIGTIAVSWSQSLHGGICLSVSVGHHEAETSTRQMQRSKCSVTITPWSLPWKKKGSKQVKASNEETEAVAAQVIWDLSKAKFESTTPEPTQGYFLAVVVGDGFALLLGDLPEIAYKRIQATETTTMGMTNTAPAILMWKREHAMGRQVYSTWVRFGEEEGSHLMVMEVGAGSEEGEEESKVVVSVDGHKVMEVKNLLWNFRGNQIIIVDGRSLEVFWDVHECLFHSNNIHSPPLFMFLPHHP